MHASSRFIETSFRGRTLGPLSAWGYSISPRPLGSWRPLALSPGCVHRDSSPALMSRRIKQDSFLYLKGQVAVAHSTCSTLGYPPPNFFPLMVGRRTLIWDKELGIWGPNLVVIFSRVLAKVVANLLLWQSYPLVRKISFIILIKGLNSFSG